MLDEVKVNGGSVMPLGEDVGELFQLPKLNEDIKQDRYLFTAINMITPAIVRDRPHMKDGGLNVHNPCLRHTGDFVRRGRIVPLLTNTHTPIPVEEVNTENSAYFEIPPGGDMTFRGDGPLATEGGYVGYPAYPGQQIGHILEGSVIGGIQRLLGEISTLKGHKYTLKDMGGFLSDAELWKIQLAIFPNYPIVPTTLSDFTQQIQIAFDSNTGDIRNVAQDMLPICQQCDSWAVRHIETVHQNMAQAATKGYAHPYDQVDLLILEQLGMKREDEHYKRTAQQAAATAQQSKGISHEEYVSMKNEIIAEWRTEQGAAKPFTYVPDVFKAHPSDPSLCAICGFDKMNKSAHPDDLQVNQNTMAAAPIAEELKPENFDLSGERPKEVHWKVWEKWQKDAAVQKASE